MENNFKDNENIIEITKAISFLLDDGLTNMSVEQLEEIRDRHKLLIEQQVFWMSQDNFFRFYKDLKDYGNWLCDYIADVERDSWGE
jgi:hypothetical protein